MLKILAYIIECMNGIRIALSPFIAGIILGMLAIFGIEGTMGKVLGILFICTGLMVGVYWAVSVAKRKGTTNFISKVDASPDIDKLDKRS